MFAKNIQATALAAAEHTSERGKLKSDSLQQALVSTQAQLDELQVGVVVMCGWCVEFGGVW